MLVLLIIAGLVALVFGARILVVGAVSIARVLGMSELLIGLRLSRQASLPEVAASVIATLRGERDIAIGNVVGSSIFNILSVLGLGAAVSPPAWLCLRKQLWLLTSPSWWPLRSRVC